MDKEKIASENYKKGYNCAQAVLSAYAAELGMDETTAYKLMEGLGGGVGGMREVCGAFSAAAVVISYYTSSGSMDGKSKADTYKTVRRAADLFKERYGSVICREILQNDPAPCHEKVEQAVRVIQQIISETEK